MRAYEHRRPDQSPVPQGPDPALRGAADRPRGAGRAPAGGPPGPGARGAGADGHPDLGGAGPAAVRPGRAAVLRLERRPPPAVGEEQPGAARGRADGAARGGGGGAAAGAEPGVLRRVRGPARRPGLGDAVRARAGASSSPASCRPSWPAWRLEGEAKQRFVAIETELAELSTRFSNNLLDATKAYALVLREPAEVEGLPASVLAAAAQSAARSSAGRGRRAGRGDRRARPLAHHPGGAAVRARSWSTARRRDLRERLYRAFVTRASAGEHDNQPLIERILRAAPGGGAAAGLRLVTPSWACSARWPSEVPRGRGAAGRAAPGQPIARPARAGRADRVRPAADRRRRADAVAVGRRASGPSACASSATPTSEEELRPYFPLPARAGRAVRAGPAAVRRGDPRRPTARRRCGTRTCASSGSRDEDGTPRAAFFLDPYSRPADKRGGAWVAGCLDRKRQPDGSVRLPVAYVVCNQAPPVDGKPSLMTFREVETLFHEFGHALQHMLTTVDDAGRRRHQQHRVGRGRAAQPVHGELVLPPPDPAVVRPPLPDRRAAARGAVRQDLPPRAPTAPGSQFLRQLYFATLDLELHHRFDPDGATTCWPCSGGWRPRTPSSPPLPEDRFLCGFSHIFAGGYAAGYYSYKWAEVLSRRRLRRLRGGGPGRRRGAGRAPAGASATPCSRWAAAATPARCFETSAGAPASTEALLRHAGLVANATTPVRQDRQRTSESDSVAGRATPRQCRGNMPVQRANVQLCRRAMNVDR